MKKTMINFVGRLKKYMEETNIKQIDLAQRTGMSRGSISNIMSGKRTPSEKLLVELSKMSGKTINWWLFGTEEYRNLSSLEMLITNLIKTGEIDEAGNYDEEIKEILVRLMNKEIKVMAQKIKGHE